MFMPCLWLIGVMANNLKNSKLHSQSANSWLIFTDIWYYIVKVQILSLTYSFLFTAINQGLENTCFIRIWAGEELYCPD